MSDFEKVKTKKELYAMIRKYQFALNKQMIEYLKSLIELEVSAVKSYVEETEKMALLSELEVYQKIAIYNIYSKAMQILKQEESQLEIESNRDQVARLRAYLDKNEIFEFDYDYSLEEGCKTTNIGRIELYETIYAPDMKKDECKKVQEELEKLQKEKNPFSSSAKSAEILFGEELYGSDDSEWGFEQSDRIREQKNRLEIISQKKDLTESEKREIEITQKINRLMLQDFGISEESFTPEIDEPMYLEIIKANLKLAGKEYTPKIKETPLPNGVQIRYLKKMPGLEITSTKKYIY